MRLLYVMLVSVLLASFTSTAWADPGKDESGHGLYESHDRHDAWKRALEHRREAAKDRREHEREAAKAWAEMEREERKHREEMRREAREHRYETHQEVETIIYVPWNDVV